MSQPVQPMLRSLLLLLFTGWIAYTCFKRAIIPPRDNFSWWHLESYKVNKNPLTRILNVLVGILVLAIGLNAIFHK